MVAIFDRFEERLEVRDGPGLDRRREQHQR
jgi:hypothetical protein